MKNPFEYRGLVPQTFASKTEAAAWYCARFPEMRKVNREGESDWNPADGNRRYVLVPGGLPGL